jgi:hypothetical protein
MYSNFLYQVVWNMSPMNLTVKVAADALQMDKAYSGKCVTV